MRYEETIYYKDELNDEFSGVTRTPIRVDSKYRYIHKNPIWIVISFFVYRIIMTPIAFLYMKCKFHIRIYNRKILKAARKTGYFMYGNHTMLPGDGYIPTLMTFPKKDIVVVNADNVSLRGTKTFMEMIGAYPIPNDLSGMPHFMDGLKYYTSCNKSLVIYPEAHIWPYYTKIRPFKDGSFAYPIIFHKPVYSFTVTYQKRKRGNKPRVSVYIDGPFQVDASLNRREAQKMLRNEVYNKMVEQSKHSTYEAIKYRRKSAQ